MRKKMLYGCDISCRFLEYLGFSDSELEPGADDGRPTSEAMQELYKGFAEVVHRELSAGRWGPVDWVEVSVGDDNEDYEDSTQIEYFFRVECTLTEQEVEKDLDSRVITRLVLRLTEEALNKLKSELQEHLEDYSLSSSEIETTEPKPKDA